jgi:glycosyltransferase involved in cell wall biosynthesis
MNQKLEEGRPRYEIIVVDNNSTDDTWRTVDHIQGISSTVPLHYVFEKQQGLSHARNTSVVNAQGKFVAFLDDDGVAESNWLLELWRAIRSAPDIVCAYGQTLPRWEVEPPGWLDSRFGLYVGFYDLKSISRRRKDAVLGGGGNAIYLREAVLTAGGFPIDLGRSGESLLAGEEIELGTKLLAAGGKSCYAPKATMHHWIPTDRMSLEYMKRRGFGVGQSMSIIRIRNEGFLAAAAYVPWISLRLLQTGVLALLDIPSRRQSHRHFMACMAALLLGYIRSLKIMKKSRKPC